MACCSTNPGYELAGTILCPAGNILTRPPLMGQFRWYLEACEAAGREVAAGGAISPETQAALDRLIIDPGSYVNGINAHLSSFLPPNPDTQ